MVRGMESTSINESESPSGLTYHLNTEGMTSVHKCIREIQRVNTWEEK